MWEDEGWIWCDTGCRRGSPGSATVTPRNGGTFTQSRPPAHYGSKYLICHSGLLTSLLLPPPALVAYLHGAYGEDDGHDEKEDPAGQACGHSPLLEVVGQLVFDLLTDGKGLGRVSQHAEEVGLACAHVLNWRKESHVTQMTYYSSLCWSK